MPRRKIATIRIELDVERRTYIVYSPDAAGAVGTSTSLSVALGSWLRELHHVYPFTTGSQREAIAPLIEADEAYDGSR